MAYRLCLGTLKNLIRLARGLVNPKGQRLKILVVRSKHQSIIDLVASTKLFSSSSTAN